MQTSQSDILNQCLTLIEHGHATPAQCAARYPEFKELPELLEAALAVRALPMPRLDSARRQAIRERMMAQYQASHRAPAKGQKAGRSTARPGWALRAMFSAFLVIALLFAGSAGLVQAASNTVPGDGLYGLKRAVEGIQLAMASDEGRVTVLNNIARTRLDEVRILVNREQPLANSVLTDTVSSVQQALAVQPALATRNDLLGETSDAIHYAETRGAITPARGEALLNTVTMGQPFQDSSGDETATVTVTFTPSPTLTPAMTETPAATDEASDGTDNNGNDGSMTPPGLNNKPTKTRPTTGPKRTQVPGDNGNGNSNGNNGNGNQGDNGHSGGSR